MTKPWGQYRREIIDLYIEEGLKLEDVRVIMKDRYNFVASVRAYRHHFDQWHVTKYNRKERPHRRPSLRSAKQLPSPTPSHAHSPARSSPALTLATPAGPTRGFLGDLVVCSPPWGSSSSSITPPASPECLPRALSETATTAATASEHAEDVLAQYRFDQRHRAVCHVGEWSGSYPRSTRRLSLVDEERRRGHAPVDTPYAESVSGHGGYSPGAWQWQGESGRLYSDGPGHHYSSPPYSA